MQYESQTIEHIKMNDNVLENREFIDCIFVNCFLEDCMIDKCSFTGCKFINCNFISLKSKYSQLKYAEFENCNLISVPWNDLLPVGKIAFPIRKLSDCFLKYNTFIDMSFIKFNFSSNTIQYTTFDGCNLQDSCFKTNRLEETQFLNCDIRNADFREATGYCIDIKTNKLKGAKFSFPEVINLLSGLEIKID